MRDPRRARAHRPGRLTGLAAGLVAVAAIVASGCSAIPSGNGPQPASAPPPPVGAGPCCGLVVRPPQVGWSPEVVVNNFLLASAINANDYAVARQYLTKPASAAWRPGAAVTILTTEPQVTPSRGRVSGPVNRNVVLVSGQEQASLNSAGQYQPAPGGAPAPALVFVLQYTKGIYKISQLFSTATPGRVSSELLLTSDLFHLEYTPRNLYYWGRAGELVPYPVFVPIQGTNPAVTLIKDLISGPKGWLDGAAGTAFPPQAHLAQSIQVFPGPSGGRTAVVNIAMPAHIPGLNVQAMAAQLVTTLTSPVYSAPLFRSVKLKINGRPWQPPHGGGTLRLGTYQPKISQPAPGERAYYLSQGGSLHSVAAQSDRGGTTVLRGPGTGQVALSQVAVSPDGHYLAGLTGAADTVYTGNLVTSGDGQHQSLNQLRSQFSGIKFTSLSWDRLNDLWVTGTTGKGPGVWVFIRGQFPPLQVVLPSDLGRVTGLRVAPDGTRVAMITRTGADTDLVLAAVLRDHAGFLLSTPDPLGPSLPPLTSLTWFDEDHLLVVTGSQGNSQLWEVPVDGDSPKPLIKQAGILSVTAAGPRNPLYLSLAGGKKEKAIGPHQPLGDITAGQAVIYPG